MQLHNYYPRNIIFYTYKNVFIKGDFPNLSFVFCNDAQYWPRPRIQEGNLL